MTLSTHTDTHTHNTTTNTDTLNLVAERISIIKQTTTNNRSTFRKAKD